MYVIFAPTRVLHDLRSRLKRLLRCFSFGHRATRNNYFQGRLFKTLKRRMPSTQSQATLSQELLGGARAIWHPA